MQPVSNFSTGVMCSHLPGPVKIIATTRLVPVQRAVERDETPTRTKSTTRRSIANYISRIY